MCKIIAFTNVSRIKSLQKLTRTACELVSETERDGFGYAVQTASGVFGERTLTPDSFRPSKGRAALSIPFASPVSDSFGKHEQATGAALFHGRTSTNHKSLVNTHPIRKHGWTLIHNGVVSNHGRTYEMQTSNDTEHLVEYLANEGIKGIEAHLTGYYAVTALDPSGRLHVIRDSTASLFVARIESVDSYIFATKQTHIVDLCKIMKLKHSHIGEVSTNSYVIFSGSTIEKVETFTPRGRTSYESSFAGASLGRALLDELELPEPRPSIESESWTVSDDSESRFLEELRDYGSDEYTFRSYYGETMLYADFQALTDDEKLSCTVIRPDGTIVDQIDFNSMRHFEG